MTLPKILGSETEYGLVVQNAPEFDAIATSLLLVNSYNADQGLQLLWDYDQEDPLRDVRGFELDDEYDVPSPQENMAINKVLPNGARYYVDHAHPEFSTPEVTTPRDVVICAAGSMPGDLHKLWRTRDHKGYHVEYAYSCMGYEIAGALGINMAAPDREVFALVGDGSYLMMSSEIVTAVSEGIKLNLVIVQNHGFASIGALSESLGSQRFGTNYRYRDPATGMLTGEKLPVDLAANAESLGARVIRVKTIEEFRAAIATARAAEQTTAIHIETDPLAPVPSSESWWDVPVSEVAALDSTQQARKAYEVHKRDQKPLIGGTQP
jgi:3D-(3,5/4)-trihydroxycyclohexane-1,2-dione acylhydrolase (decyclizing)